MDLGFLRRHRPLQVPDLLDQVVLLVAELLVLRAVRLEMAEELDQLGLVLKQDVQHWLSLVGIGHKYLRADIQASGQCSSQIRSTSVLTVKNSKTLLTTDVK